MRERSTRHELRGWIASAHSRLLSVTLFQPLRGAIVDRVRPVRVLADAYGASAIEWRAQAIFWPPERLPEFVAWSKREKSYVEAHRAELVRALG